MNEHSLRVLYSRNGQNCHAQVNTNEILIDFLSGTVRN